VSGLKPRYSKDHVSENYHNLFRTAIATLLWSESWWGKRDLYRTKRNDGSDTSGSVLGRGRTDLDNTTKKLCYT